MSDAHHSRSAPIIAAALSGFVLGVLATVVVTGALPRHTSAQPVATLPPAQPVAKAQLYQRVSLLVTRTLGSSYPDIKKKRLVSLQLVTVPAATSSPNVPETEATFHSVWIVFRLNDHPLGRGWRLREAKADIFQTFKALYTSTLPVYDVHLTGIFPVRVGKSVRDRTAVVVDMTHRTAAAIPWAKWGREHEGRVWTLTKHQISPQFA